MFCALVLSVAVPTIPTVVISLSLLQDEYKLGITLKYSQDLYLPVVFKLKSS